jgi:hypothetical protein
MRLRCLDYQMIRNMSRKQIPEMCLSEDKIVNPLGLVRDPYLTHMKLQKRTQKTATAGTSAAVIVVTNLSRR